MSKHSRLNAYKVSGFTFLVAAAMLAACGGGGGNGNGGDNQAQGGPEANPTPVPDSAAGTLLLDTYVGSFVSSCHRSDEVRAGTADGPLVYVTHTVTTEKAGAQSLRFSTVDNFYAPGDSKCEGATLGQIHSDSASNLASFGSPITIITAGETLNGHRVTWSKARIADISGGGTVTLNALNFPGTYLSRETTDKNFLVKGADPKKWFVGDRLAELDASGFTTKLRAGFFYAKQ